MFYTSIPICFSFIFRSGVGVVFRIETENKTLRLVIIASFFLLLANMKRLERSLVVTTMCYVPHQTNNFPFSVIRRLPPPEAQTQNQQEPLK